MRTIGRFACGALLFLGSAALVGAQEVPMKKYPAMVEFTTVLPVSQDPKFPAGESYEKNIFTDWQEKNLNIKQKVLWQAPKDGDQYSNKLAITIASGDIPDMFEVSGTKRFSLMDQLIEADMLEDLTPYYNAEASDHLKGIDKTWGNGLYAPWVRNGKLYGIPNTIDNTGNVNLIWVRQDWIRELKLPNPDSIENLRTVAKAFAKKSGIGLSVRSNPNVSEKGGQMHTLDAIFNYYGAVPTIWTRDKAGTIVWGGIQPEVKTALKVIAEMYKNGEIDKEFALKDAGKTTEDLSAGKSGLMMMPWWAGFWPLQNSISNDPKADWKAYVLAKNGVVSPAVGLPADAFLVVRKGYAHPEALFRLMNLQTAAKKGRSLEYLNMRLKNYADVTEKWPAFPSIMGAHDPKDDLLGVMTAILNASTGKAKMDTLDTEQTSIVNKILSIKAQTDAKVASKDSIGEWQMYISWIQGGGAQVGTKIVPVVDQVSEITPTMEKKWTTLSDLQKDTYIKIILGTMPVDKGFDDFVKKWKELGGDQITKEVNPKKK